MSPSHPETPDAPTWDMSITVGENTAREMGLTRRDVDEWALYSTENALRSIDEGAFDAEIVPVQVIDPDGNAARCSASTSTRGAARRWRRSARCPCSTPRSTAPPSPPGTRPGLNDAAAAVVVTSSDYADIARASPPRTGRVVGVGRASSPRAPASGPRSRSRRRSTAPGSRSTDIDLCEINEAFCSVPIAASRKLGIPQEIMNVNGSGASLGHPIACTGARMVVTMVNELHRSDKSLGCVSMCAGGGMGSALVLEAL